MRTLAIFLIAALLCCGQDRRPIAVTEATGLVNALLKPDGWTRLRGFVLYQALFDAEFQDFYFIHAEWDSPAHNSAAIGHFAVERATGDVWDWVICGQFHSPSLTAAQQALRKRIGLTDAEYLKIRKPGPFCEPNEKPQILKMGKPHGTAMREHADKR
ncbi:MAG TPA: hypothetical protein VNU44_06645 [Bryobacteraceae bacterium]|nr:hypothetical protein [Bryobacteraceae bacterium]